MNAPDLISPRGQVQSLPQSLSLELFVIGCAVRESQRTASVPLIRGLGPASFSLLNMMCMPNESIENGVPPRPLFDEFDELFELLIDYAQPLDQLSIWLAAAIATAAQRDNHLWQDLGLPSRNELSAILAKRFPALVAANSSDMKWKKFFYRQLCLRAEVPICKSPNCADCVDQAVCFGPEE